MPSSIPFRLPVILLVREGDKHRRATDEEILRAAAAIHEREDRKKRRGSGAIYVADGNRPDKPIARYD